MKKYVAYYRVSTNKQGVSGLGLEAQRSSIQAFVGDLSLIIGEHTEVESGKHNNRPRLLEALEQAKQNNAILIVAKLDRLSRNMVFIATLIESNVKFVCADMPEANTLTLHMIGAVAQYEREMISKRVKDAMKAAKERGVTYGCPDFATIKERSKAFALALQPVIDQLPNKSFNAIAKALNAKGILTQRGKQWTACGVSNHYKTMNETL